MKAIFMIKAGVRRSGFAWVLKSSACLHGLAGLLMLFVLARMENRTWLSRSFFISHNQGLVIFAWSCSIAAIVGLIGTFAVLAFALDRKFRIILQWAWMIQLIGGLALALHHFLQIVLIPLLFEMMWRMPSPPLFRHVEEWNRLLGYVGTVFVPSCLAIGGLIYTAVMFRSHAFSQKLSWWSLAVWALLVSGSIAVHWSFLSFAVMLGMANLVYLPWLWSAADRVYVDQG